MAKKTGWLLGLVVVGAVGLLVVGVVFLDPTCVVRGYLTGEPFFAGRPVTYWRLALKSTDPAVQTKALEQLQDGGQAALPVLIPLLSAKESTGWDTAVVRWKAANLLGGLGAKGRDALPALLVALQDEDAHVRTVAAASLGAIVVPEDASKVVTSLVTLVKADGPEGAAASRALSRLRREAAPAIPTLIAALTGQDTEARWNAARTLGKIGLATDGVVPALVKALKDDQALVREHAAEALGDIGPGARDGVAALIEVLKDPEPRVRRDAARSLGQIGEAKAVVALKGLAGDPDQAVREAASKAVRLLTTSR